MTEGTWSAVLASSTTRRMLREAADDAQQFGLINEARRLEIERIVVRDDLAARDAGKLIDALRKKLATL